MTDYMVRAIAANEQVRAFAVTAKDLVEYARAAHNTSPIATAALGRTMCGALMMADMLKGDDDVLTIQIKGDGPLHSITVTADNHFQVKGYVGNPSVILPPEENGHLNVAEGIGHGTLAVSRDLENGEIYSSAVELSNSEVAGDLTHYFAESEQVPSSVGLGVLMNHDNTVKAAGGFIIQLMPDTDEAVISKLEENLRTVRPVTEMLSEGMTPEQMLKTVLDGFDVEILSSDPVHFVCNCSHERVERALRLLGPDELDDMIRDNKPVTLHCQFCEKQYSFTVEELRAIRAQMDAKAPQTASN